MISVCLVVIVLDDNADSHTAVISCRFVEPQSYLKTLKAVRRQSDSRVFTSEQATTLYQIEYFGTEYSKYDYR
jgi:hypothetical protein